MNCPAGAITNCVTVGFQSDLLILTEVPPFSHHAGSGQHCIGVIDAKDINGGKSASGAAKQRSTMPFKMFLPDIMTRMKQRRNLPFNRINTRHVRPLSGIAAQAGKREILHLGIAPMLLGDNVVHLKRQDGPFRAQMAVLAALLCAGTHSRGDGWRHPAHAAGLSSRRYRRAFDCIKSTRVPRRR